MEEEYEMHCKDQGYISEFVRFHLFSGYHAAFRGKVETPTTNVIRTLDQDLDEILSDFEHKVRSNIHKALEGGVVVEFDAEGKRMEEFLEIYYKTMERKKARSCYYFAKDCFVNINEMHGNCMYVHALFEGKVISSELLIYGEDNCYSFLGGCDADYFHLRPNDLLKFEVIRWAKEKNLKRLILGGGCGKDDSLFRYKRAFAPSGLYHFYIGKRIFDEKKHQQLIDIRRQEEGFDPDTDFFPQYRAELMQ